MRRAPRVRLNPVERRTLERWASSGPRGGRLALRSRIVLKAARGSTNAEIAAELATHPETVARWRSRFVVNGLEGVEQEAPRLGGAHRVAPSDVGRILTATTGGDRVPEGGWTTRTLARTLNVNHMLVHRVWRAHGLTGRSSQGVRSPTTPRVDLAGAIVTPGIRAVVFSVGSGLSGPPVGTSAATDQPDIELARLLANPVAAADLVVRSVRKLERIGRKDLRGSGSPAPLLVFLRGLERRRGPHVRLDVVIDRGQGRVGARVLAWLDAHPNFRLFAAKPGQTWSQAVASWLGRWETTALDRESLQDATALETAFPLRRIRGRRTLDRFSWHASPRGR